MADSGHLKNKKIAISQKLKIRNLTIQGDVGCHLVN